MRISIVGESVCARALRDRCHNSKFAVADLFFDYRITIEEDPKVKTIGIDGVKSRERDIEDYVEDMIGERLREANLNVRITKFPVGGVRAANEVVVTIPPNPAIERAVEIGCFNALGWLVRRQDQKNSPRQPQREQKEEKPQPKPKSKLLQKLRGRTAGFISWALLLCILLAGRSLLGQPIILPPGTGGTQYTEGATQATPTGTVALARDASNVLKSLLIDASRNLVVSCAVGCSGSSFADNSPFTAGTTAISNTGGVFNDGLAAVTSANSAAFRITAQRGLHINLRNNAGAETGVAAVPLQVSLANTAANATAVKVDGSAVTQPVSGTFWQATQPVSAASLPLPTGASTLAEQQTQTTALQLIDNLPVAQGSATTGQSGILAQGAVTTAPPVYTTAQTSPLSLTTAGLLRTDGSGVTQPVSGTVTIGTFPDNEPINVALINGVTPLMGNGPTGTGSLRVTQANDASAIANWGHAAVAAAPPTGATYIAGKTSGATGGLLAGIVICDQFANIQQTANTQVITGVASRRVYICSINLVTAAAQNVSVVAGTGTTCATTTVAVPGLSGGATAALGWNLAANTGIAHGGGIGAIGKTTVDADNVCVFNSAAVQLSGGISFAIL